MKKLELVYRELLFQAMEKSNRTITQSSLAKALKISLSTVNFALQPLRRMNAITIKPRCFTVIDPKKILYYWASVRNLQKDILYKARIEAPVREIEKLMPDTIIYTAYSAYKFKFRDVPADYSEVYVYGDDNLKNRFPQTSLTPNIIILKIDPAMEKYGKTATSAQLFVDLWNMKEWYAKDFLKALEVKIGRLLE